MSLPANSQRNDVSLTERVKAEARRLGFQLVGVTTPSPPPHYDVYMRWLAAGFHGEMAYLATERACEHRADPRLILPECQAVLVLGVRYPTPTSATLETQPILRGQIASYSWGEDYHLVLPQRLEQLVGFIENQVGQKIPNRWYTDTGPILERDLAQQAGLGWIGKNSCLIHPRQGSYFLLAEILLGISLEPDTPFATDHCGSCTRCLDACPTQCILSDRTIDAASCISYLTIELKSEIPVHLRSQMGAWVFGCDVCQEVCPWNIRFSEPNGDPAFGPWKNMPAPDMCEELQLTREEFNEKFKNSPVKRTKRRGYLRNVAVALGNTKNPAAVPSLAHAMHDSEPLIRAHAAWALGEIGGQAAHETLLAVQQGETNLEVLAEISRALSHLS